MSIPKIIHQIAPANKDDWHPLWLKCCQTWQKHFPDFDYKLWNDEDDIDKFVRDYYPQYYNIYLEFPLHIMRIDFARLFILHHYGGIYADMDVYCHSNFYEQLEKDLCLGGEMDFINYNYNYNTYRAYVETSIKTEVSNYLMCSTKNHSFLLTYADYIIKQIQKFNSIPSWDIKKLNNREDLVIESSGPCALYKSLLLTGYLSQVQILDYKKFNRPDDCTSVVYTEHFNTIMWK